MSALRTRVGFYMLYFTRSSVRVSGCCLWVIHLFSKKASLIGGDAVTPRAAHQMTGCYIRNTIVPIRMAVVLLRYFFYKEMMLQTVLIRCTRNTFNNWKTILKVIKSWGKAVFLIISKIFSQFSCSLIILIFIYFQASLPSVPLCMIYILCCLSLTDFCSSFLV